MDTDKQAIRGARLCEPQQYASVFKSAAFDVLRNKRLMETNADDFLAVFKDGQVSIVNFLKGLHNFAWSLGWIGCRGNVNRRLCEMKFRLWPTDFFNRLQGGIGKH